MFFIKKIRWLIFRLFETHPNIQDTFPSFKGVSLDELMNSRSLYLHAKRVMAAVESTISALDDAEVLVESLTSLGRRHRSWSIREEHFKVLKEQTKNLGLFAEMVMALVYKRAWTINCGGYSLNDKISGSVLWHKNATGAKTHIKSNCVICWSGDVWYLSFWYVKYYERVSERSLFTVFVVSLALKLKKLKET